MPQGLIIPAGTPIIESIVIQTRPGTDIPNSQETGPLLPKDLLQANIYERTYTNVVFRTKPCGYYNCHGLTFASRRSWITEHSDVHLILKEDNYKEISQADAGSGDVVVYFEKGDPLHSGIVVEVIRNAIIPDQKILSKWGGLQECVHNLRDCPYSSQFVKYYRVISHCYGPR